MNAENKSKSSNDYLVTALFFLLPTLMLIVGYILFPYDIEEQSVLNLLLIPLFSGIILLGVGFLLKNREIGSIIKIAGWFLFSLYWAMLPYHLYASEGGDIFNATVCIIGIYVLIYMAYHEWLSVKRNEHPTCLNWIAGGTFLAGIIYFTIDSGIFPVLKDGFIEIVARQSAWILNLFGLETELNAPFVTFNGETIKIIFACTAIQAMVLFVGMIGALSKINWRRRVLAMTLTVIPIYFLNLVRNASVIYLVGSNITDFNIAHNYLAKLGALITLIALLFVVFKILPELYDEIASIFDLVKRKGPVENFFSRLVGKKGK